MTGLEALNKFVNIFAEYCVKTQHQEMNATNMQTAVEYLARSEECRTIEKSLKALEIIKKKNVDVDYFLFWCKQGVGKVEDYNQLLKHKNGRCQRLQLTEKEFNLLKEVSV